MNDWYCCHHWSYPLKKKTTMPMWNTWGNLHLFPCTRVEYFFSIIVSVSSRDRSQVIRKYGRQIVDIVAYTFLVQTRIWRWTAKRHYLFLPHNVPHCTDWLEEPNCRNLLLDSWFRFREETWALLFLLMCYFRMAHFERKILIRVLGAISTETWGGVPGIPIWNADF